MKCRIWQTGLRDSSAAMQAAVPENFSAYLPWRSKLTPRRHDARLADLQEPYEVT